jgi:hypothetical protein
MNLFFRFCGALPLFYIELSLCHTIKGAWLELTHISVLMGPLRPGDSDEPLRWVAGKGLIERNGFREFYKSYSGKCYGVKNCGMATLAADMPEGTGG